MNQVKAFRVTGEIHKPNLETSFKKEVIAVKREQAVEKVYAELGSRHRVKRFHIEISKVEEIQPEEIEDSQLKRLLVGKE
jgi:large subunit ribosomal protein LX